MARRIRIGRRRFRGARRFRRRIGGGRRRTAGAFKRRRFGTRRRVIRRKRAGLKYSKALRSTLCQPQTLEDRKVWVQGWTGNNSGQQSWFSMNVMDPKFITHMYQQAISTSVAAAGQTALGIDWFMGKFRQRIDLTNTSKTKMRVSAFVCYPRRDILHRVTDLTAVSVLELTAIGAHYQSAVAPASCLNTQYNIATATSAQEPTDSTNNCLWIPGTSPFNSVTFCRMFKVVRVKHMRLNPGGEAQMRFKLKPRKMSISRYLPFRSSAMAIASQYVLENQYQCLKGYPVVFFRAHGCPTCDASAQAGKTNEFTTSLTATVGYTMHELTGIISTRIESYAPFVLPTRRAYITSTSRQAGPGPGIDTNINAADQQFLGPTTIENVADIE